MAVRTLSWAQLSFARWLVCNSAHPVSSRANGFIYEGLVPRAS